MGEIADRLKRRALNEEILRAPYLPQTEAREELAVLVRAADERYRAQRRRRALKPARVTR